MSSPFGSRTRRSTRAAGSSGPSTYGTNTAPPTASVYRHTLIHRQANRLPTSRNISSLTYAGKIRRYRLPSGAP